MGKNQKSFLGRSVIFAESMDEINATFENDVKRVAFEMKKTLDKLNPINPYDSSVAMMALANLSAMVVAGQESSWTEADADYMKNYENALSTYRKMAQEGTLFVSHE